MSTSTIASTKLQDDMNNIPLADDDPQVIIPEEENNVDNNSRACDSLNHGQSMDSLISSFTNDSCSRNSLDPDISPDEQQEKARLIAQVLELQNTLDDLSQRVDGVKEENLKLKSENQVLGQYIENLMSASSVFQSTSPKNKK
ncbi:PREDICTED: short coiled-coil protein B isoform X2 [Ceratosolen solmsi marchali]|uniref:Short coiled-coil protein B isoform X2 n=1 Tax=Ceratosolen solmsi marchali TaxID=326594 RepID=A0AAJ6VJ27_9HYME|nr:PREDICTED: short coiled-coil protein B isoform X2 [Ceratosolen solmsi marchali]